MSAAAASRSHLLALTFYGFTSSSLHFTSPGIGLAHICNAKGYKCVIYMPNTQSKEKMDTLRCGMAVRSCRSEKQNHC